MPQVSLYFDESTLEKIERAAEQEKTSISNWVTDTIKNILRRDYPDGFFDLFGSIDDETFTEPQEVDPQFTIRRETL